MSAWIDDLPRIRAENDAWRLEMLPTVKAKQAEKQKRRDACQAILSRALNAINATDAERMLVFDQTGFLA